MFSGADTCSGKQSLKHELTAMLAELIQVFQDFQQVA
ncbi:hypothetical protein N172_00460 [Pantoea dispersa EGD-AAK13]|nr:hypothetical protein N172_00460 [Pantoea dispersa EGD-AAK13]